VVFARWRLCAPTPNTCLLRPTGVHIPNDILISSAIFLHSSWQRFPILYNVPPFLTSKMPLPMGASGPHLTHNAKWHLAWFSSFCTAHYRVSLYFTMGCLFRVSKFPFPWGDLDAHLIRGSLGPPESSTEMASRSVQPFLQGSLL